MESVVVDVALERRSGGAKSFNVSLIHSNFARANYLTRIKKFEY